MPPCFVSTGLCHVSNIPLVGSISVKLHGKWDNLTFSRGSSRLAADVISFLRIAGLLQSAVFLITIPYVIYHLCQSRNNFVFVWRFCFKDCHSLHDFGETALIDVLLDCWVVIWDYSHDSLCIRVPQRESGGSKAQGSIHEINLKARSRSSSTTTSSRAQ